MRARLLRSRRVVIAATMAAAVVSVLAAQQAPPAQPNFDAVTVRSFKVQDHVFMLAGAGGNITAQIGNDGVLVVDTQFAQMADKLLAEIARLSGNKPIRYVIDTHVHPDHVGGNERFRRAGRAIVAGNVAGDVRGNEGATVIAHETVAARMSQQDGTTPPAPGGAIPTDTFFGESDEVFFNGEAVQLIHQPAAHTDGDVMVFFRKSDVIATGDVYVNTSYPVIDTARGGTINGIIAGLNHIIEITVPRDKQEGGTMVIPGTVASPTKLTSSSTATW
jgi:glyoxylase-like metal-dependent hydrolase (beta-lactamase superfamily II)